jgi:hypothetical protein
MSTTSLIQKQVTTIKAVDTKKRQVEFIASHEVVDADSELIRIDGMDLRRYHKNPLICAMHDHRVPVARTIRLVKQTLDGAPALVGTAEFPRDDVDAEVCYRKIQSGLYGAVSVGFLSLEQGPPRLPGQRGVTHVRSELLEISIVSIPSCPNCVITGKAHPGALLEVDEGLLRSALRSSLPLVLAHTDTYMKQEINAALNRRRGRVD